MDDFFGNADRMMARHFELDARKTNPAIDIGENIVDTIKAFESKLPADHEVAITVLSGAQLRITRISHSGRLIRFDGLDEEGRKAVLIQSPSQVNLLLVALPKLGERATRIGFIDSGQEA